MQMRNILCEAIFIPEGMQRSSKSLMILGIIVSILIAYINHTKK